MSVSVKRSSGFDEVPYNLLKQFVDQIKTPLSDLINISSSEGVLPKILKKASVQPIYKKGDTKNI